MFGFLMPTTTYGVMPLARGQTHDFDFSQGEMT